jgi:hypothetical protein
MGLVFLPTARFTAGLSALGTASPALLTAAVIRDNIRVVPAEVHAVRPVPGTHCRAIVMLRKNNFVR